jgi:hypothetical protein
MIEMATALVVRFPEREASGIPWGMAMRKGQNLQKWMFQHQRRFCTESTG